MLLLRLLLLLIVSDSSSLSMPGSDVLLIKGVDDEVPLDSPQDSQVLS